MPTKKEIEALLLDAALRNAKDINAAARKLVEICTPSHSMIKGKHVIGPSVVEDAAAKCFERINENPFE